MACVGRHVFVCLCGALERGAARTGGGWVPSWRLGVWGLEAVLASSHVTNGAGVGLRNRRDRKSDKGVLPLWVGSGVIEAKSWASLFGMASRASSNKESKHSACWPERSSGRADSGCRTRVRLHPVLQVNNIRPRSLASFRQAIPVTAP
jgi:hypothetical protein